MCCTYIRPYQRIGENIAASHAIIIVSKPDGHDETAVERMN